MPAKTPRRHRQGEESRQRILQAALDVASERGYDGATVAQITKKAGLPASSIYWQFQNKDELLASALDFSYRSWRQDGPTWQPNNYAGSIQDRILTRMANSRKAVEDQPAFWLMGLMVSLIKRDEPIAAQTQFREVREETRLIIEEWWRTILPNEDRVNEPLPQLLSDTYLALVDGMFICHRAEPTFNLERLNEVIGQAWARVAEQLSELPPNAITVPSGGSLTQPSDTPADQAEESSRIRLLRAAGLVAAENGYRGTTVSKVCKKAGLPASSIYWFFEDKDHLLAEVVQHSWDDWYSHQPAWSPPVEGEEWHEALHRILSSSTRSLYEAPSYLRIGHLLTLENPDQEVAARQQFLIIREGITTAIAQWFAQYLPDQALANQPDLPDVLAHSVVVLTDGFFLDSQISPIRKQTEPFVWLLDLIFKAAVDQAMTSAPPST